VYRSADRSSAGGNDSGSVVASDRIGPVKIGHDVQADSTNSGKIATDGKLVGVNIGGSLLGGSQGGSGRVESDGGTGFVRIGINVQGGMGNGSGVILTSGRLDVVNVQGSLVGGGGAGTGAIVTEGSIGTVTIGRNILGGDVAASGYLYTPGNLASLTVGGSLVGTKAETGYIEVGGNAARGEDWWRCAGWKWFEIGSIEVGWDLASVQVDGSLAGGTTSDTGQILVSNLGTVKIGGNVLGSSIAGTQASLSRTGYIECDGRLGNLTVDGSVFAGWDASTAGALTKNASIRSDFTMGSVVVKGSLHGHATAEGLSPVVIAGRGNPAPTGDTNVRHR
jgi:hypothetical protein